MEYFPSQANLTGNMHKFFLLLAVCGLTLSAQAESKTAIFAGGCFWCMQEPFDQVKGVTQTVVGYTGTPFTSSTDAGTGNVAVYEGP